MLVGRLRSHRLIAHLSLCAGGVIDVFANEPRAELDARRAHRALLVVIDERRLDPALMRLDPLPKADPVLQRHAGALREILQGRVCGIPKQSDPPIDPSRDRLAVAQHPELPVGAVADDLPRPLADMLEAAIDLLVADGLAGDRLGGVVVIGDDEIEDLPALQGIMHDMAFGPGPERRRIPAQILGHLLGRDHRAIGGMAGDHRRAVTDHLRPDVRPETVRTDQRRSAYAGAVGQRNGHARSVLLIAHDAARCTDVDQRMGTAAVEQGRMEVGAMDNGVGIAEALAERLVERDGGNALVADRVHQQQAVDVDRFRTHIVADAQRIKSMEGIRPDLDAGPDLTERRGLLKHERGDTGLGETERCGKPADAAAGDEDRKR